MRCRILTLLTSLLLLVVSVTNAQDNARLVVAWLASDGVHTWHTWDAAPTSYVTPEDLTPNIQELLISADGQYVAVNATTPGRLWLAAPNDPNLAELVPNEALPATDEQKYQNIENLQRGEKNNFYFNTVDKPSHYVMQNNDLWIVDAASRTIKLLLPATQAGPFSVSPDYQHIAIIQPGTYGAVDGKVILADKEGQNRQDITTFSAISSGSDNDFILPSFWQTDNKAFNIAIPNKDLVYNDNTATTDLWQITSDGTKTQRGTLQASIFGLPQWSFDGQYLTYLRHQGDISTNQFELVVASGDGSNPATYADGAVGSIGVPQWLPESSQFIYAQGEPGDYWLGQMGQPPQKLADKIFEPHFVSSTTYVFVNAAGELRYAQLGSSDSTLIASVGSTTPIFDALLLPDASD